MGLAVGGFLCIFLRKYISCVLTIGGGRRYSAVLIRRRLSWRAERVNDFFKKLDGNVWAEKSPQARREMKRVLGEASSRPLPAGMSKWAVISV